MNPFVKYLQDTRAELRHVAWPTQAQTIVYTTLVVLFSVGVSLYLGLFDFIFTTTLARALRVIPSAAPQEQQLKVGSTNPEDLNAQVSTSAPVTAPAPAPASSNSFSIPTK